MRKGDERKERQREADGGGRDRNSGGGGAFCLDGRAVCRVRGMEWGWWMGPGRRRNSVAQEQEMKRKL